MEPYSREQIPLDVLEWARTQIDEEQIAADLVSVRTNGGLELRDFIAELEAIADSDE